MAVRTSGASFGASFSPMVLPVDTAQEVTSSTYEIQHGGKSLVRIFASSALSLNTASNVQAGTTNGQVLWIQNVGTSNVSLYDRGTNANSRLELTTQPTALSAKDTIGLVWNADEGAWFEMATKSNPT